MPDGELVAVSYGIISTPKDATPAARLEMLFDQLNALLKEQKPDTAAVEKLFFPIQCQDRVGSGTGSRRDHALFAKSRHRTF